MATTAAAGAAEEGMEPNEKSAMISRLSTAYNHGAVDVPDESIPRRGWIQGKFTQVYLLLCIVSLFCIATFTIVLVLTLRLSEMGHKYDDMSKNANQGLRSITNLFSYPGGSEATEDAAQQQHQQGMGDQSLDYQSHPRAGAAKTLQDGEHQWIARAGDHSPALQRTLSAGSARRNTCSFTPRDTTGGIDPALFRPENLPNLLKLAAALHIDLTKLPKEYQALLPQPINATVVKKSDAESASSTTEERVIQKAPAHPITPAPEDYEAEEEDTEAPVKVEKKLEKEVSTSTTTVGPSESGVETTTAAAAAAPVVGREPVNAEAMNSAKMEEIPVDKNEALRTNVTSTAADTRQFHTVSGSDGKEKKKGMWRDASCGTHGKCENEDYSSPPLVVISIDGFAHDYLKRRLTPVLDRMADCGATAEFVYPSYPSKTFPNHFTMVTGVWPAHHGIVDNSIYDPTLSTDLESMKRNLQNHSAYFKAEPIWSSYKRVTGKKAACLFWVGCQHNITEYNPDYNLPYEKDMSFDERVDNIISWLSLPASDRPGLITAYFHQVDTAAHWEKSPEETDNALIAVNDAIVSLFDQLEEKGILECVNVVIVSDHGMQKLTNRVYFDDHFSSEGLIVATGVVGRLYWNGSKQQPSDIMKDFRCSGGEEYRVYSPSSLPPRCHYASRLVGDVIFEGQLGTTFYSNQWVDPMLTADHGYDYLLPPMRAIFFARGPSIRPKTRLPPFQNVEYYHFFEDLLGMKDTKETNGTRGMLDAAMLKAPEREAEKIAMLSECPRIRTDATAIPCRRCTNVERTALDTLFKSLGDVTTVNTQIGVEDGVKTDSELCLSPFHDIVMAAPRHSKNGTRIFVEALSLTGIRSYPGISGNCSFEDACSGERQPVGFEMTSVLAGNGSGFGGLSKSEIPLHSSFVKGFLSPLQTLTHEYLRRYGRLLSFTGTIFDYDTDGRADATVNSSIPSHIFRILLSCRHWDSDSSCSDPSESAVISWMIPHIELDFNCLPSDKLLFSYTARVRDIELATGVRFFADRRIIPENIAKSISTFIPDRLW
ncbi:hypothetical protein PRIPAC_76456 [Pristionchus pacificus]|uniref:Uncharacterized protein n=1 Tax=Pristionchus pacificus TaxID=54126 RepID=A0A2A6CS31_PRIPA|nr:hypothetical protein PRIPAC_76456 [Pristionchus pacificus]|eukprot:PDM81022.1 hypothetical protein PRIPAC_36025 [Pristionchus pacificus]